MRPLIPSDVSKHLPLEARNALFDAAKIEPQYAVGDSFNRTHALEFAIARVKATHPSYFKQGY